MIAQKQRVTVLGSTGSIGVNTLDVLARHPQLFSVFALSGHSRIDVLFSQCLVHQPEFVVATEPGPAVQLQSRLAAEGSHTRVLIGHEALDEVAAHPEVDMVMAAIVGAAGLSSCIAAARAGKRLLLANKEALVVGGSFFMDAVRTGKARCCRLTASIRPFSNRCPPTAHSGPRLLTKSSSRRPEDLFAPAIRQP